MTSQTPRFPRSRDVVGHLLDPELLLEAAKNSPLLSKWTDEEKAQLHDGPTPQAIFDGQLASHIVNNEGVRTQTNSEGGIEVYFSYGMMWTPITLDMEDISECIRRDLGGEPVEVNLADVIRNYNDRLQSNFYYARNAILTGVEVAL